jgi:predicted DNA-binding transcriptional regulator YafY
MRKSDRLFQVVNLIRVHQPITADALAERIGVSARTIYLYIDDLSVSGIPLYGVAGVGYSLREGFELPPLTLTRTELDALMLGVEMLSTAAGTELATSARTLLSKITAALPSADVPPSLSSIRALRVRPATAHQRRLDELNRAIQQASAVRFSYVSLNEATSDRTVFPLGLFYWGGKWTVGTWCVSRQAYRDFRIDRMHNLQIMTDGQKLGAEWNLRAYMQFQSAQWAAHPAMKH